jgi:ubiquinol-cytochrome c reductase cytochrome b subunit
LPFILAALVAGHLYYLHVNGSSNPIGTTSNADRAAFHPYFSFKDLITLFLFFVLFTLILFYTPDKLGHSDNYIEANPMQTPASINYIITITLISFFNCHQLISQNV